MKFKATGYISVALTIEFEAEDRSDALEFVDDERSDQLWRDACDFSMPHGWTVEDAEIEEVK